jgi:hypothetical protein
MLPLVLPTATLIVSSLLAMPLVAELAAAADAREAGLNAPTATTIAAGAAIAVLYPLGGLIVLARPPLAAGVFLLAAVIGFLFGHEDGRDGLAVYGVLALPLAAASVASSRLLSPDTKPPT